jgi:lysophospholipase L1-like esterase
MKKFILLMSAVALLTIPAVARPRTLWMVGDGSMAEYTDSVEAKGWVQYLSDAFAPKKGVVLNESFIGNSLHMFTNDKAAIRIEKVPARTIMFVQFGTNDLKEYSAEQHSSLDAFVHRLDELITIARRNKVNVVLCTPLAQPYYKDGKLIDRLGGYAEGVRRVAAYNHVALLDLEQMTRAWLAAMSEEEAAKYYVTIDKEQVKEGEYLLNAEGAKVVAQMAKEAIKNVNSKKLKKILKK